jgi:hypothetical protein
MQIATLLKSDPDRMAALKAVANLGLPDCWLAAGFVRNMVWDALHGYAPTPLSDVDVIFYDSGDQAGARAQSAQEALHAHHPHQHWEVRNQARMHASNGDPPYKDSADAMSFWPEIETAIGACLDSHGELQLLAPFGTESLTAGFITPNPRRSYELFLSRVQSKKWLQKWPSLRIVAYQDLRADAASPRHSALTLVRQAQLGASYRVPH